MQNSVTFKKPQDTDSFQLIKSGSTLNINYYLQSLAPIQDHQHFGTVTINSALVLKPFDNLPDNPVNGMLAVVGTPGNQDLWCYINNTWKKVVLL